MWRELEAGIYVIMLLLLAWHRPLRELVRALPLWQQLTLGGLLFGLVMGQLVGEASGRAPLYPFATWSMYSNIGSDDMVFYEYTGVHADGSTVVLRPNQLFRTQGLRLLFALRRSGERGRRGDESGLQRHRRVLQSVAQRYNRLHPDQPLVAIRVTRCVIPSKNFAGRDSVVRTSLWELTVER